ncbi:MAG: hypothetical protein GY854_26890 [Deltaproteobacteria bacterium]|nr:hypothetical protein [Deltaproteobacteria bacterium]
MKTSKTQKRFVDYGCGFPVVLRNVPMVRVRGFRTPDIDYNELHKAVLRALAYKPTRLTGNQIKFIRQYFELTLVQFGEYFDVSHPAVLKWENAGDDVPSIKWSLERDLRLFIMDRLNVAPQMLGELYKGLRSRARLPKNNELDLDKIAATRPSKTDISGGNILATGH